MSDNGLEVSDNRWEVSRRLNGSGSVEYFGPTLDMIQLDGLGSVAKGQYEKNGGAVFEGDAKSAIHMRGV